MGSHGVTTGRLAMPRKFAACFAILMLSAACATAPKAPPPPVQDVFILLPDDQGKTGAIIVSGAGGKRLLSEPGQAVTVAPGAPPGVHVVVGATPVGGPPRRYNYLLSLERAQAVASFLIAERVDPSLLAIDSHGEDNPLVPTGDEVSEPRNRRVEVTGR